MDYHMHYEYGQYEERWCGRFFEVGKGRGLKRFGVSEHSHGFKEFAEYYGELRLDDKAVGKYQRGWLANKFKHSLAQYFELMAKLKRKYPVATGIEVCNFADQKAVGDLLDSYPFDYRIGSVHFLWGWGFDSKALIEEWAAHDLEAIYAEYTAQALKLIASDNYDILGHPFNLNIFGHEAAFDATKYYEAVIRALKAAAMASEINSGTQYRYPIGKITPNEEYMQIAADYKLKMTFGSDAHAPEDSGRGYEMAKEYGKRYGVRIDETGGALRQA